MAFFRADGKAVQQVNGTAVEGVCYGEGSLIEHHCQGFTSIRDMRLKNVSGLFTTPMLFSD